MSRRGWWNLEIEVGRGRGGWGWGVGGGAVMGLGRGGVPLFTGMNFFSPFRSASVSLHLSFCVSVSLSPRCVSPHLSHALSLFIHLSLSLSLLVCLSVCLSHLALSLVPYYLSLAFFLLFPFFFFFFRLDTVNWALNVKSQSNNPKPLGLLLSKSGQTDLHEYLNTREEVAVCHDLRVMSYLDFTES